MSEGGCSFRMGRVHSAQPWPPGGHAFLLEKEASDPESEIRMMPTKQDMVLTGHH